MITSIDEFKEGLNLSNLPRMVKETRWQKWYDGNFDGLFPDPTIDNGYKLLGEDDVTRSKNLVKINMFKLASNFYKNGAVAERPSITTDNTQLEEWLNQQRENLYNAIDRAAKDWAIKARATIVTYLPEGSDTGEVEAVNPTNHYSFEEGDDITHVILEPYVEGEANYNNRIKILKYIEGELNIIQVFQLSQGGVIEHLLEEEAGDISEICTAGQDDSWYDDAQNMGAEVMLRFSLNRRAFNKSDNRIKVMPSTILKTGVPGERKTDQDIFKEFVNQVEPVITTSGGVNVAELGTIGESYDTKERQSEFVRAVEIFAFQAGLPPSAFGLMTSRTESGDAREMSQIAATSRVRDFRNDLSRCIPRILTGMNAPEGDVIVEWIATPFESRRARWERLLQLVDKGVPIDVVLPMLGFQEAKVGGAD